MKFVNANGQTLCYTDEGNSGGRPLIWLNSLGTTMAIWDDVVPEFVDRYRVIRTDKRGHGLSSCPPAPYAMRELAEDVIGLLDQLQIERCVMIGVSVGGMIVQEITAGWPERVAGLVLMDTAPKIGTAENWNTRITTLNAKGMGYLREDILARWFTPAFKQKNPAAYRGYGHMLGRTPLQGYIGVCAAIRDADLTAAAAGIVAPTLVLCGAEDAATSPELVKGMADLIPGASYHEIPNAGHLPCVERPAATARAVQKFLQEIHYE